MKQAKKKYTLDQYVERMLLQDKHDYCVFCKYNYKNYDINTLPNAMRSFFLEKCEHCTHYKGSIHPKTWRADNYKPLYNWDKEKKEK